MRKKYICKYVRKYGLSITEIAEELGVSHGTAWNWLRDPVTRRVVVNDLDLPRKPAAFAQSGISGRT